MRGRWAAEGADTGGSTWLQFRGQWVLLPNLVTYLRGLLLPVFVVLLE